MSTVIVLDDPAYTITDTFGGWILSFRDPAMYHEHELAIRDTLADAQEAYERISDGEDVSLWPEGWERS